MDTKNLLKKWKRLVEKKSTNMACILNFIVPHQILLNPITGYRSVCTVLHPVRLLSLPLRVIANVSDLARSFCIDAYSPVQFYLHMQPIQVPLPSFIICKFILSTYPVSFNLSMSQRSRQLILFVNTIPSRICFDTGSSWYIPSFKTIMSIYSVDSVP